MAYKLAVIFGFCLAYSQAQSKELCENGGGKFDAIVSTPSNDVYILKGDRVWHLIGDKDKGFQLDRNGYPKLIGEIWPGLPGDIGTAYTNYGNGQTYFFKGNQIWVYKGNRLQPGYPKTVTQEFSNLPNSIDGAFICTGMNYFFKGDQVYSGSRGSPLKSIGKHWRGLPNNMHAVIQFPSRGHTFFFKDYQFYKYRVWNGPVEPGYPKEVVPFWFQCDEELDIDERFGNGKDYDTPDGEVETQIP